MTKANFPHLFLPIKIIMSNFPHFFDIKNDVFPNYFIRNSELYSESPATYAINSINRRKSADYYNITIEHFLYSKDQIISILVLLINNIFRTGEIPDSLKIGLLSPIYNNKGSKNDDTA